MKKNKTAKFSTWTLWAPLKFAVTSFCIMITTAFIYSLIAGAIYTPSSIPQTPLLILLALGLAGAIAIEIKSLPHAKIDRTSFIAIHTTQTIILSGLFIISSYLLAYYAQQIMFYLFMLETRISATFTITLTASLLFYLYIMGLLFANIYAKYRRARTFNIPAWKILFSIPFGFSALWAPGYIIKSTSNKATTFPPQSKFLNCITNWIIARPSHTIASFILVTTFSGFFFGFNLVLLTFSLTLIFGIWALQSGTKNVTKNIANKYATSSVIFNIAIISITILFFALTPPTTQNVEINISDIQTIENIPE